LPCTPYDSSSESICDACLRAKAHQLPYPVSTSRSTAPLELIFSDVWGPGIDSFGRKKYYVSFIDDYSKFTLIYLLRHKSEVFKFFAEFQSLVERMLNHKILAVQFDWAVSMRSLIPFFALSSLHTMSRAHMPTNKMVPLNASTVISLR
jgi:hypothetical protein